MVKCDRLPDLVASCQKLESYDKAWFEDKYLREGLNCRQIADLIGNVTRQGVWKKIKKLGIPIRSRDDSIFMADGKRCWVSQGYFWIWNPYHHRANNGWVKRSVLNLEEKLGRLLKEGEFPHHIDGNRMNDDPDNLVSTDRSNHMSIHSPVNHRWNNNGG